MRGRYQLKRQRFAEVGGRSVRESGAVLTDTPLSRVHEAQPTEPAVPVTPQQVTKSCANCGRTGIRGFTAVGSQYFCQTQDACKKRAAKRP